LYHLRGNARVESTDSLLTADEVDYDDDTKEALARGHVHFENYVNGDKLDCDHAQYNVDSETGKFFLVKGTSPAKVQSRPGILTSSNPFYFEGQWAERLETKYVLHDGFITDCKMPDPWWKLTGPKFDIIPGDRALAYRAVFRIRSIPIFWAPALYKSLKRLPRKSGFLTPNIGNSSSRGKMLGTGYFWAINRSYDLSYRGLWYTQRGFAHDFGFRGKVKPGTDFGVTVYGVNDTGLKQNGVIVQQASGFNLTADGRSDLGHGWFFRGQLNYLSSFIFRQTWTQSFHEAVVTESHSVADLTKHWSTYGVNVVVQRDEDFLSNTSNDAILIRKLPEFEFLSREHAVPHMPLPIYFSLDTLAGLLDRDQPAPVVTDPNEPAPLRLQTRRFVNRLDLYPRATVPLHWKGFDLVSTFGVRETEYGSSILGNRVVGNDVVRSARELEVELIFPSLARIYKAPKWLGDDKLKHVIEARAKYKLIGGIDNFNNVIRFDQVDLMSNTNEVQVSVTNRLYIKNKDGNVNEALTWEVGQSRYFDPTFGGAIVPGQRNVVASEGDLTGFAFLNGPRNYSPVSSTLRYQQRIGVEWRTDYDPLYSHIVNSSISADMRLANYFISAGHSQVRTDPILTAPTNQFRATVGWGDPNRRGWNAGASTYYDYRKGELLFATVQATYNTDCCGISVQYRRLNFGTRDETQFRVAFAISNIGTFGTLKRQERIF
jgi:LPS-assembly protein